ncbi:MAG: pyridoxal phosphate-dependent aminotransferase [Thermodesulfobacteriota bacterium]
MTTPAIPLAARLSPIKPSPTLAVDAKAKALKAAGAPILNFSVGEPDFDTPAHVREAAKAAIDQGFTRYTAVGGIAELKEAIAGRLREDHGWTYGQDEIVVSCGGKHGLYNLAQAVFQPGDEVLIPSPYWVSYPPIVQLAGAAPVLVPLAEADGFDLRPEVLERLVTPRTRGIILNSPSNPTGAVFSTAALETVARLARQHRWLVVSDDIYDTIVFDNEPLPHILRIAPDLRDQVLIVNGVSKSFAMTGWRIGHTVGPKHIIGAMTKIQSQSTSNPSSIAQKAAAAALAGPQDFPQAMTQSFRERRDLIMARLAAIPGVTCVKPKGAFYVFPNLAAYFGKSVGGRVIQGSLDLADYLLEEASLATVPGVAFGADAFIRFSFATARADIEAGMDRLRDALARLG